MTTQARELFARTDNASTEMEDVITLLGLLYDDMEVHVKRFERISVYQSQVGLSLRELIRINGEIIDAVKQYSQEARSR